MGTIGPAEQAHFVGGGGIRSETISDDDVVRQLRDQDVAAEGLNSDRSEKCDTFFREGVVGYNLFHEALENALADVAEAAELANSQDISQQKVIITDSMV